MIKDSMPKKKNVIKIKGLKGSPHTPNYSFRNGKFLNGVVVLGWLDLDGDKIEWKNNYLKNNHEQNLEKIIKEAGGIEIFVQKHTDLYSTYKSNIESEELALKKQEAIPLFREEEQVKSAVKEDSCRKIVSTAGSAFRDGVEARVVGMRAVNRREIEIPFGRNDKRPERGIIEIDYYNLQSYNFNPGSLVWVTYTEPESYYKYRLVGRYSITGKRIK